MSNTACRRLSGNAAVFVFFCTALSMTFLAFQLNNIPKNGDARATLAKHNIEGRANASGASNVTTPQELAANNGSIILDDSYALTSAPLEHGSNMAERSPITSAGAAPPAALAVPPDFDPALNTNGCLITKDDLALVPEWIAYHYHAMQMRYLIVAVDPLSVTNVTDVFERFRRELPDLTIVELRDEDFLPRWFVVDKDYTKLRRYHDVLRIRDPEQRRLAVQLKIHQMRQRTLMCYCTVRIREQQREKAEELGSAGKQERSSKSQPNWLMHIDSDEFMVPNPLWRLDPNITAFLPTPISKEATAGSVVRFVHDVQAYFPKYGHPYPPPSKTCMIMAMVSFGGITPGMISRNERSAIPKFDSPHWIDNPEVPQPFNASRFETVSYHFHRSIINRTLSSCMGGCQKAMMDVDIFGPLPANDITVVGPEVPLVHYPSKVQCRVMRGPQDAHRDPLMLHHYKGSLERFTFRDDSRRTPKEYQAQAMVQEQQDDGWITTWVKHFVALHGADKVARLLGNHFVLGKDDQWVIEKKRMVNASSTAKSSSHIGRV